MVIKKKIDPGKLPVNEHIALLMVAFFIKFQADYLTEEGGEKLMAFFNLILMALNLEYRFPKKLSTLKVHAKVDQFFLKDVEEYVVCEKCQQHFLWKEQDGVVTNLDYNCPNCKNVAIFQSETRILPCRSFFYKSIIGTLRDFFYRPGFDALLRKLWKRKTLPGFIGDSCDGSNWSTLKVNGTVFTQESYRNLMLQFNVDWMQPWEHTTHSTGCMYMTILNLPREVRNQRSNSLLVGMITGPKEPSADVMHNYMQRMTNDLRRLMDGVQMEVHGKGMQTVKAALGSLASDIPAQRKSCGFAGHSASMSSSQ